MDIRKMLLSDYSLLNELWMSCKGMGLNNLDDSLEGIERFLKRNPDTCYVATENDSIIGIIMAGNDGRRGYIYHTAVAHQYRNQGIGKRLVEKAIHGLKKLGINKVALVVFSQNEEGNSFWENLGFYKREDLIYRDMSLVEMIRIDT